MKKYFKYIAIAVTACTLGSAASANTATVNPDHYASLQDAYKFVLSKSYDEAQDIYKDIQASNDVERDIKRAAAEGEGLVLLLQLNIRILESKDDEVKARFVRFQRRNVVGYLTKAFKTYKSDTLAYMIALAGEAEELSEESFKGLRFSGEYTRLLNAEPEAPEKLPEVTVAISKPEPSQGAAPKAETGNANGAVETPIKATLYAAKRAVNIRSGPGVGFARIGGLSGGQKRTVVATVRLKNGQIWLKFKGQSGFGYASSRLFTKAIAGQAAPTNTAVKPAAAKPTVEAKPATKPAVAAAPVKPVSAGNRACAGGGRSSYSVKSKVAVLSAPGGPVIFSYNKNVRINIVNVQSGYLVLRIGQASGNFKCGYIRYDQAALKKIN